MAALADIDGTVVVEDRLRGVHVHGQLRLGEDEVQQGHDLQVVRQLLGVGPGLGAQLRQDPSNLLFFLQLQLP